MTDLPGINMDEVIPSEPIIIREDGKVIKKKPIQSINYSQEQIIRDIIELHLDGKDIECDPTYSKGVFYKKINRPKYTYDIDPQDNITVQADCRSLPLQDGSIESIMIDLPFVIGGGPSLKTPKDGSNIISKRFSNFNNPQELFDVYFESIKEAYRVLKLGGVLIFKCQDQVSSGKQFVLHCMVYEWAKVIGFYCKDIFILLAKNRLTSGKWKTQRHSRKHHSYFMIFVKK